MKRLLNTLLFAVCVVCFSLGQTRAAVAGYDYKITPDVVYGHKAGMALTFDVVQPKKPTGAGVLFMVSGGWVSFWVPPETAVGPASPAFVRFFNELLDHGFTLFIVRHGSSPQFKVPEAVADVRRAVRFIRLNAARFDVDPNRLGVCGGSAGGHLSLVLGTSSDAGDKSAKDDVDKTSDRVAAVVAYFPPVDIREWVGTRTKEFPALDFDKKLADGISPILFVSDDDPPTLLVHGDKDTLVPLSNSERIEKEFKKHHVPCELKIMRGAGHGFAGKQNDEAAQALVAWFDKYLSKRPKEKDADKKPADGNAATSP